jgi:hypothetical protein
MYEMLNTQKEKSVTYHSFFDLPRAAIIRDSPAVRLRKAAKGKCACFMLLV